MTEPECRLAYGLHKQFGRVCSRKGGNAICGECIRDIDAPAMGFRRMQGAERATIDAEAHAEARGSDEVMSGHSSSENRSEATPASRHQPFSKGR